MACLGAADANGASGFDGIRGVRVAGHDGGGKCDWCRTIVVSMNGFLPLDTSELATLAACQGLRTAAGGNLNMAQIDIECAYSRSRQPARLVRAHGAARRFGGPTLSRTAPRLMLGQVN